MAWICLSVISHQYVDSSRENAFGIQFFVYLAY